MCHSTAAESDISRSEVWDKIALGIFLLSLYVLCPQAPKAQGTASKISGGAQVTGSHLHRGNHGESIKRMLPVKYVQAVDE